MSSYRLLVGASLLLASSTAFAQSTIRIGIQDDPDTLDPARSRTYAARIVFTSLCDKLVDLSPTLAVVPQLATSWSWSADNKVLTMTLRQGVTFHDGEPFDAAAVKFNLDRDRTMPESLRKSELSSVGSVDVVDAKTVAIKLKQPDATLMAQLTDRAGMMLSPKASTGDVSLKPVCSGPYKFAQRVQQDRIVLDRYEGYWNKQAYHFDKVIYRPISDTSVRLANLRSGDLDLIERVAPTDVKSAKADPTLHVDVTPGLGYTFIVFNLANGPRSKTPLGEDKRVRKAFEWAIDRKTINDVVFEGIYTPTTQPFPPSGAYFDKATPIPGRDIAKAKALLAAAGVKTPIKVDMLGYNNPLQQQVGQIIQAMTAEAGFEVNLRPTETATLLNQQQIGNFQMSTQYWSGRPDPDGNIQLFVGCHGSTNDAHYCNPKLDEVLAKARTVSDVAERKALYDQVTAILEDDVPTIDLYFEPRFIAMQRKVQGFVGNPDGLIRLGGVSFGK